MTNEQIETGNEILRRIKFNEDVIISLTDALKVQERASPVEDAFMLNVKNDRANPVFLYTEEYGNFLAWQIKMRKKAIQKLKDEFEQL